MSGCSGKCDGCGDTKQGFGADFNPSRTNRSSSKSDDFLHLMKNTPEPKGDLTSLDEICPHYPFGKIQRSGCEACLKMWAIAHSYQACNEMVKELKQSGKSVASKRLIEIIKELAATKPDWKEEA